MEGSAPSQGSDANCFVSGPFGCQSLEHGRRQVLGTAGKTQKESGHLHPKESRWKKFARQGNLLTIKCKYRHCLISMPVFVCFLLTFCWHQKNGLIRCSPTAACGQIQPGALQGNKIMAQRLHDASHPLSVQCLWRRWFRQMLVANCFISSLNHQIKCGQKHQRQKCG